MVDLRRRVARLGYGLLFAWILLFVVLVGHVGWDDPHRLQYVTADIWFDILVVMIGVPFGLLYFVAVIQAICRPAGFR